MSEQTSALGIEPLVLRAADGYPVSATRFHAPVRPQGRIVVAGAIGAPQGFYRRFAEHASGRGFETLTLDYRGIGGSRRGSLREFRTHLLDWARLDLAAAVDAMAGDGLPLSVVAHSFGGHALGLLPNHGRVAACWMFGTGAGWHGWMPLAENLRVRFAWAVLLPLLVRWKGYAPMSLLGAGEDLPRGVYEPWRRWCSFPHYFLDDPACADLAERYEAVRMPIVAANALDDAWAPPCSRDAFVRGYRQAPIQTVDCDPAALGGRIGHMGYFRPNARPLWDAALDWLGGEAVPAGGATAARRACAAWS